MDAEYLRTRLDYDPETGVLTWKPTGIAWWDAKYAGREAGTTNVRGYVTFGLNYKRLQAHRVAWAMHYGSWPDLAIDHINGVSSDNRIVNLREATPSQNSANRPTLRTNALRGAYVTSSGRYQAQIKRCGRVVSLGTFATEAEAHEAFCRAVSDLHGEFARHD